jgi:hypothetical protein
MTMLTMCRAIEEISGIELHAWLCGGNSEYATAFRLNDAGGLPEFSRLPIQDPVVIVPMA